MRLRQEGGRGWGSCNDVAEPFGEGWEEAFNAQGISYPYLPGNRVCNRPAAPITGTRRQSACWPHGGHLKNKPYFQVASPGLRKIFPLSDEAFLTSALHVSPLLLLTIHHPKYDDLLFLLHPFWGPISLLCSPNRALCPFLVPSTSFIVLLLLRVLGGMKHGGQGCLPPASFLLKPEMLKHCPPDSALCRFSVPPCSPRCSNQQQRN